MQMKRQQAMAANYAGTQGTFIYSVHVINHKNIINMRSNNVILPVLTSWHTQREQTIHVVSDTAHDGQNIILTAKICQFMYVVLYVCFVSPSLLDICSIPGRLDLHKLLVASLDYSHDNHSRVVLSKLLTSKEKVQIASL